MFDVEKIRADFPILNQMVYNKPLVYMDSGATAQKPQVVIDAVNTIHTTLNSNIHRGVHFLSSRCTDMYEEARESVRKYINGPKRENIIFTSGATASINMVAATFGNSIVKKGDHVLVSQMEHHSNIVPWQILCEQKGAYLKVIPISTVGDIDMEAFKSMLSERTRIVAITQCSNVLGSITPLKEIISLTHSAGGYVVVDGCQGIVHGGVDVTNLDCDFYAFSGHKLYGPTGIGVLYGKEELLEDMPPFMSGGDMVARVSFERTTFAELPLKFEPGTANYIGAIGLGAAINYLCSIDMEGAYAHEKKLTEYATKKLLSIDGLKIYGTSLNKCSIISFNIDGAHSSDVGMILDKQGVALRTGTHCAEPLMHFYGVTGMVRSSMAFYNTLAEVDVLEASLRRAAAMLQ